LNIRTQVIVPIKKKHPGWEVDQGKEGLIMTDFKRIADSFPSEYPEKLRTLSVFSFALGCGARAGSCANVKLSDIIFVRKLDSGKYFDLFISNYFIGKHLVRVTLTHVKGNMGNSKHAISFVGLLNDPGRWNHNFVYWLNLYLEECGFPLSIWKDWNQKVLLLQSCINMKGERGK
jgi:hypothetical protein